MKVKTKSITMRYRGDLADKVAVLKCRPGGVTKIFEDALMAIQVTDEELAAMRLLRGVSVETKG